MNLAEELARKWLWDVRRQDQWYEIFEGQIELDNQRLHNNFVRAINEAIERCAQLADTLPLRQTRAANCAGKRRHLWPAPFALCRVFKGERC